MPPMLDFGAPSMFNARNVVAGVVAVLFVLGAWFGLRALFAEDVEEPPPPAAAPEPMAEAPPPEEPEQVEVVEEVEAPYPSVLVAKRRIEAGEMLAPGLLEWRYWRQPIDLESVLSKEEGFFTGDDGELELNDAYGGVARLSIEAGAPIQRDAFIGPGSPGFITAVLAADHQAVAVNVGGAAANAGVIYPGDRVDVILIYSQGGGGQALTASGPVAQVIVSDVRVLAIGATVLQMRRHGWLGVGGSVAAPVTGAPYTLEVLPEDAQRIALAATTGQIDLALRSTLPATEGGSQADHPRLVDFDDVMRPPAALPGEEAARVRIIRGDGRTSEELVLLPERLAEQTAGS